MVMYLLLPKAIKVMKGLENSELCLHLATLKKTQFSKPTVPVSLSLCSFVSELVLLAKIDLSCATIMQGLWCVYLYVHKKALGWKGKGDIANSDFFICEIFSIAATLILGFFCISNYDQTKCLLSYCYKVPKNQQEVPKIWIVNITFLTFILA